ncbi:MAG: 16S rRNA (adenine(1518)-N(6)/adenine(1519)-N(6))-dimethyltransferase [Candidatus Riflebacteria bacterium]|nr:16S rRNA (adenine(1518)-N(6)/adenine(1519)-N(6))-dimethyltransferase [Candidatus Riflebacteria bacterium]
MDEERHESTRNILARAGLIAKKSLGQNFCQDETVITSVVERLAIGPNDEVWEIGPGVGALTRILLSTSAHLRLFEIDLRLKGILETLCASPRQNNTPGAIIHWGDVLDADLQALHPMRTTDFSEAGRDEELSKQQSDNFEIEAGDSKSRQGFIFPHARDCRLLVCGNLPYYCGTAIVRHLLELKPPAQKLVFVLQEEVVQKMAAGPGDDEYGFLSVIVQLASQVSVGPSFPPSAFFPNPAVTSALVELRPLTISEIKRRQCERASKIASIAFGQRRKMALNVLKKAFPAVAWAERFENLKLSPKARAEEISVENFLNLATE